MNVSRGVQPPGDEAADAGHATELPENKASAAIRSRLVFHALTGPQPGRMPTGDGGGGERAVLDVSRLALAMDMCGLDGDTYGTMFALSKWARFATLDLDEFVTLIERFSSPVRLRDRLRRSVHDYAAGKGLRIVDATREGHGDRSQWSLTEDARGNDPAAVLQGWDDILDGLRHV